MLRVLDTTDANGSAFTTSLFSGSERTYLQAICDTHAGGTWTLQARVPGGAWVDTDTTFAAAGLARWAAADDFHYRFRGGTTGARITVAAESSLKLVPA